MSNYEVICPKCGKAAPWVENKEKYGRNYGASFMCYYCKPCGTYVGCHQNTMRPLGVMGDETTLQLRRDAHTAFDRLWKTGNMTRSEAYQDLADTFGEEVHIGGSDAARCRKIIELYGATDPDEWI